MLNATWGLNTKKKSGIVAVLKKKINQVTHRWAKQKGKAKVTHRWAKQKGKAKIFCGKATLER